MIKLKTLLTEGFAWERKEGRGLPTLAEVQAEYEAKQLKENAGDLFDEIADELGLTSVEFDNALNKSGAELDIIERLYNSDSYTRTEALSEIADMLDIPFGYYKNKSANTNQSHDSYEAMSDKALIDAINDHGMEEMIIHGPDGDLENRDELIDLLNAEDEYADDGVDDGGRPSGSSREVDEASRAKPDFLDLDGDGNKTEPMKSAATDSTDSGNYINKARAKSHLARKDGSVYGIDGSGKGHKITNTSDLDKYSKWTIKSESMKDVSGEKSRFSDYSNDALKDMIINMRRHELNKYDAYDIKKIEQELARRKKNESAELTLEQRILRNLNGNDYILKETFRR